MRSLGVKTLAQRARIQSVLVVDDQFLYRSGLRTILAAENDLRIVGEAGTVPEALLQGRLVNPDVVVMSASLLASASGAEREQVRKWAERAAFVLVGDPGAVRSSGGLDNAEPLAAIPKDTSPTKILETIRRAGRKEEHSSPGFNSTGTDLTALAKAHQGGTSTLTTREQEVVKLLAEGRTVRETAAELALSAKTVDAHKLNAMRKLDIHNREKLIQYAISHRIVTTV